LDDINAVIAENLKQLREDRKLSLDNMAKLTGVSKSMLGQIERGDVNPTMNTLWKIANGLKLSFTELIIRPETDVELIDMKQIQPFLDDGGRFRNYPVVPFDSLRRFELFSIEIDPGGRRESEPHPAGAQEFITIFSGALTVTVNGEDFPLKTGNTFRFAADRPHAYRSSGEDMCRISMVIYYAQ
jgi:transcriptional regulator with XRE-family HTH domain